MPTPKPSLIPPALPSDRKDRQLVALLVLNGVVCFLLFIALVFVVPVFAAMFKDFGAKLPAPTQFLLDLSNFVKAWWWLLFVPLGVALAGSLYFLERNFGRRGVLMLLFVECLVLLGIVVAVFLPIFH